MLRTALASLVVLALAACGAQTPGEPGAQIDVVHDVEYYPACGNELVEIAGTTYYPFTPEGDGFTPPVVTDLAVVAGLSLASAPRVVPPGPGDDVGTVVIYEGGVAHFRSDSGRLEQWLTTERQEYDWVC